MDAPLFDIEQGLIELPGAPARWIWAFTCPITACGCRTAIVVSTPGDRETLRERARPVADAWLGQGRYGQAAQDVQGVTALAIDLDTRDLFPPVSDTPLNAANCTEEVKAVAERLDDDVLDAIARIWYRGKGKEPPPEPGVGGANIEVEGVEAHVPPPAEKRIAIGGQFLDEVNIRRSAPAFLSFPVDNHHGEIGGDGVVTIHAKMPTIVELFAEGALTPVGGAPADVMVAGKKLGPMVLAEVRCTGGGGHHDIVVLVFRGADVNGIQAPISAKPKSSAGWRCGSNFP